MGVGSSWAAMPVLGELPQELQRRLAGQRSKWGAGGAALGESVLHSAVMGFLLVACEVGRPQYPVRERVEFGGEVWARGGNGQHAVERLKGQLRRRGTC